MFISGTTIMNSFKDLLRNIDFQGTTNKNGQTNHTFTDMHVKKFEDVLTHALRQTYSRNKNYTHVLNKVATADRATHALHPDTAPTAQADFMTPKLIEAASFDVCNQNYTNHLQHLEYNRALVAVIGLIYR